MAESFNNHFSTGAEDYSTYRPSYPDALFESFVHLAPSTACAWDCATGNGQAAIALGKHFDEVIATDASESQISTATPDQHVRYRVATAEASGLADESVDLITVAQALHWFDIETFAREAERVLRPSGVLAAWTYNLLCIDDDIDSCIHDFYSTILGQYWPSERRMVENGYRDIALPFTEVESPLVDMTQQWTFAQVLGYLDTWSAVSAYKKDHGVNPLDTMKDELAERWGDPAASKTIVWPLTIRIWVK